MVHTGSGSVILDLWDSSAGGPYNDRLASTGIVSFDFGSSLFLETVDGFQPGKGSMFDLMLAEDLRFGTETDADFDLFDYVSAPFLNRNHWALSLIDGYGSFENTGVMAGLASPELLRLTRIAPIPLPGSLLLYGSVLVFVAGARRLRRQSLMRDRRQVVQTTASGKVRCTAARI